MRVIRAEDQTTKPKKALSLFCKELLISLLVSRFCMSNRAEKQIASKVKIYLVIPEYFINVNFQHIHQIRPYQCSSKVLEKMELDWF